MAQKKYLSLERLQEYDALIKQEIADSVSGKANSSHTHDDRYYTESEIDTKIAAIDTSISNITSGTIVVKEAEHSTTADSATTAGSATTAVTAETANAVAWANVTGKPSTYAPSSHNHDDIYYTETEVDTLLAGKSDSNHNHDTKYDTKGAAADALASAQTYADNAATNVKNDLLNGAGSAYDTLKELGDLIDDNQDAIEALEAVAAGKADKTHSHSDATTSAAGFMTAEMVAKLNGIAEGANKTTIDSSLSTSSTNPVQNKIVATALNTATSAISANTDSISAHSTAISNLQTAISEIQEITSAEIQALFAAN